ncbi:putative linker histone H1/H5, domain H15, winged helix-like DNA-binding domain superfamily [Dioscorea sansibarensis]
MAAAGEAEPVVPPVADEQQEKKPRTTKAPKEKKPVEAAKPASPNHPPYFQMIKEAILALHGKEGSSSYAIAKYMEEKHKEELPGNFKKMLAVQLRSFAAKGKLLKVKASFKLPESEKKDNKDDHEEEMKVAEPKKEMKKKAVVPLKSEVNKKVGVRKTRKAALVKAKQPKSIKKG